VGPQSSVAPDPPPAGPGLRYRRPGRRSRADSAHPAAGPGFPARRRGTTGGPATAFAGVGEARPPFANDRADADRTRIIPTPVDGRRRSAASHRAVPPPAARAETRPGRSRATGPRGSSPHIRTWPVAFWNRLIARGVLLNRIRVGFRHGQAHFRTRDRIRCHLHFSGTASALPRRGG